MDIVVCVKPVPDVNIISLTDHGETRIDSDDLVYVLNPSDLVAVEEALRIKEQTGEGRVLIVSMSPPSNERLIQRCLALGADEAICIWDRHFDHTDSLTTGRILAKAIAAQPYDLILSGQKAADTGDGQVGYVIAGVLDIPIISSVTRIQISHQDSIATVEKKLPKGYRERLEVTLPAFLAMEGSLNEPRYASLPDLMDSLRKEIRRFDMKDLGLSSKEAGATACKKRLLGVSTPKPRPKKIFTPDSSLSAAERMQLIMSGGVTEKNNELFEGSPETLSVKFVDYLEQLNIDWGSEEM